MTSTKSDKKKLDVIQPRPSQGPDTGENKDFNIKLSRGFEPGTSKHNMLPGDPSPYQLLLLGDNQVCNTFQRFVEDG